MNCCRGTGSPPKPRYQSGGYVKVVAPRRDEIAGMGQVVEEVFVQAFVAHPGIRNMAAYVTSNSVRENHVGCDDIVKPL